MKGIACVVVAARGEGASAATLRATSVELTASGAVLELAGGVPEVIAQSSTVGLIVRIPPSPATLLATVLPGMTVGAPRLAVTFVARDSPSHQHLVAVLDLVAEGGLPFLVKSDGELAEPGGDGDD